MRAATTALIDLINQVRAETDALLLFADTFTFTLLNGTVLTYTSFDVPFEWNGYNYVANSLKVDGLKFKCKVGLNVDQQKITISALSTDLIGNIPALAAIQQGVLDGAQIQRERVFFSSGPPTLGAVGSVILFKGRVGKIEGVGRTTATITVNADTVLLADTSMPRNLFAPNCQWILYGYGCAISKADFGYAGTVGASPSAASIAWTPPGGLSVADLVQGTITFSTGVNEGLSFNIKNASGSQIIFSYPLYNVPAPGDAFTVYFGCDHTMATCQSRFNNLANFRGFPFVPPPTFSV